MRQMSSRRFVKINHAKAAANWVVTVLNIVGIDALRAIMCIPIIHSEIHHPTLYLGQCRLSFRLLRGADKIRHRHSIYSTEKL
jgi:hypothetical protein